MHDISEGRSDAQRAVRLIDLAGTDQAANAAAVDWRSYETPLPQVVAMLGARRSGAFYDVGANTGYYTVLMGRYGLAQTVRCFEPVPAIAEMCRTNIRANQLEIEVTEAALGSSSGVVELYLPPAEHGLVETSASLRPDFKESIATSLRVPMITLDGFNESVGGEGVGLIKVDVEGAEDQVLAGANELTEHFRPLFTVELLPQSNWDAVDSFMLRHGYVVIPISNSSGFEIRRNASFVADALNQLLVPHEEAEDTLALLRNIEQDRTLDEAMRREDPGRALMIEAEVDRRSYAAWVDAHRSPNHRSETAQELQEVYASTSWRVTRPLRAFGRLLGRR